MNLLLDTHALLWSLITPDQLDDDARREISDPNNDVYVSAATAWEIAIKRGLGKLATPPDVQTWLPVQLSAARFTPIPVTVAHALGVERLPLHHRDPFDRILIAQANAEDMALVTRDRFFESYQVRLLRC